MDDQKPTNEDQALNEYDKMAWISRDCPTCSGAGLVIVFHQQTSEEVAAHCICTLGRWMRSKTTEALKARIPDGAAILEGQSSWLFQPPGAEPEERFEAPTRAAITRRFGKISEST